MKDCYDLVTLPECVVSKIHINRRKYFSPSFIELQIKIRMNFSHSVTTMSY